MPDYAALTDPGLMVIFTYAPAGLGHLRVTDALYEGLPDKVDPLILGSNDEAIRRIHRITSTYPVLREMTEWAQKEGISLYLMPFYRRYLRANSTELYLQMKTILEQRIERPKEVLVVATHFGLAHQIATIKKQIEKEENVRIYLAVQVTDDSPQEIWYIDGADLVFVPSSFTKKRLLKCAKKLGLSKIRFVVNPYPLSPSLGKVLTKPELAQKIAQVTQIYQSPIHISVPVSGAAVETGYYEHLIDGLNVISKKYIIHVVSKIAPFTKKFLWSMKNRLTVKVNIAGKDREVVELYDQLYKNEVILLEITKPSEQAFKAILPPSTRGGVILLFSKPIGRQEYDNLDFLRRHYLLPRLKNNEILWQLCRQGKTLKEEKMEEVLSWACGWRGLRLPADPKEAAIFIDWCFKEGIFSQMLLCTAMAKKKDRHPEELGKDGVEKFWKTIDSYIKLKK